MDKHDRSTRRIVAVAAMFAMGLIAALVPVESASADNDNWQHHRNWNGDWDNHHRDWDRGQGSLYFYTSPTYYYTPAPTYYYTPPPAYYYPPPQPYYGAPSFGLSVRFK